MVFGKNQRQDKADHSAYIKEEITLPAKYHMVDDDFELIPGIDVINLPGHTPALIGLVLHLESGTVILPQDCLYTSTVYGPPAKAAGLVYDSIAFFKSIEKVRMLEKKYKGQVFFAHDWEQFQTTKHAPEYYE